MSPGERPLCRCVGSRTCIFEAARICHKRKRNRYICKPAMGEWRRARPGEATMGVTRSRGRRQATAGRRTLFGQEPERWKQVCAVVARISELIANCWCCGWGAGDGPHDGSRGWLPTMCNESIASKRTPKGHRCHRTAESPQEPRSR